MLPYWKFEYFYSDGSANRYYHYWQILQVYLAQKTLRERIDWHQLLQVYESGDKSQSISARWKSSDNHYLIKKLIGILPYYNALSHFITLYENEERRTFDRIPVGRMLSEQAFEGFKHHQREHAREIWSTYKLNEDEVFQFLINLTYIQDEVVKDERHKLADSLAEDLNYMGGYASPCKWKRTRRNKQ